MLGTASPVSSFKVCANKLKNIFLAGVIHEGLAKSHFLQCGGYCLRENLPESLKACVFQFVKYICEHFQKLTLVSRLLGKVKKSLLIETISIK